MQRKCSDFPKYTKKLLKRTNNNIRPANKQIIPEQTEKHSESVRTGCAARRKSRTFEEPCRAGPRHSSNPSPAQKLARGKKLVEIEREAARVY